MIHHPQPPTRIAWPRLGTHHPLLLVLVALVAACAGSEREPVAAGLEDHPETERLADVIQKAIADTVLTSVRHAWDGGARGARGAQQSTAMRATQKRATNTRAAGARAASGSGTEVDPQRGAAGASGAAASEAVPSDFDFISPSGVIRADPGVVIGGLVATRVYVTMAEVGRAGTPVPGVRLVFIDTLGRRRALVTDAAGAVTTLLAPGRYRLLTTGPVVSRELRYSWDVSFVVRRGLQTIELTQRTATSVTPSHMGPGGR